MTIQIVLDSQGPASGRLITPSGEVAFDGWLSLLRLLEEALASSSEGQEPS